MEGKKILFVSTAPNWPKTDGKRQRTWFIIDALQKEYILDFIFIGGEDDFEEIKKSDQNFSDLIHCDPQGVTNLCNNIPYFFLKSKQKKSVLKFREHLSQVFRTKKNEKKYSFIFFRYLDSIFSFQFSNNDVLIADIDDVYFEKQLNNIFTKNALVYKIKSIILLTVNIIRYWIAFRRISKKFVTKIEDLKYLGLNKSFMLQNLPFAYFDEYREIEMAETIAIGFLGKLSYLPNENGILWFLENVWMELVRKFPNLKFYIAGSGKISDILKEKLNFYTGVIFMGYVDNVETFWSKISLSIVPINSGAGTNIKVAESLIFGRPVICSTFSSKGYSSALKKNIIMVADSKQQWIMKISELIINEVYLQNLSLLSAKYAFENYNRDEWKYNFLSDLKK